MGSVLERIRRIRQLDERRARLELLAKQHEQDELNRDLVAIGDRVDASHTSTLVCDAADVALHHAFALRMEMQRRQQEEKCTKHLTVVESSRESVVQASKETRVAELIEERAAAVKRKIAAAKEQRALDEMGIQGWYRGNRKAC